jgi:hypothetical protein
MNGLEVSAERRKRDAKLRRRQEERWAAKSGPVTVYYRETEAEGTATDTATPPGASGG